MTHASEATAADWTERDPQARDSQRIAPRLLWERCHYQAHQTLIETPLLLSLMALMLVTLNDRVPEFTLVSWLILVFLTVLLRFCLALTILRRGIRGDPPMLAAMLRISTGLTGLLLGASASLFFDYGDHTQRLMITFTLAVWLGPAVAIHAAFPKHARLHIGLITGQLALAWWIAEPQQGWMWVLGLGISALLLERLSGHLSQTLANAQRGRHERRSLLRRLALETRQAYEAGETAARFLAAASHDLRQPATALSLMSSLMAERCTDPALKPLTQGIARSSEALNELLGNLLDLSRLEAGIIRPELGWHRISRIVEDLRLEFEIRITGKGLRFTVEPCEGEILTDRVLLMRMLRNLLENALRYTDRGTIQLTAQRLEAVHFMISDTGIGMPPELIERLFKNAEDRLGRSTVQSRRNGLGIGLAMVTRIGALLNSSLRAESDGKSGSQMTITLPVGRSDVFASPNPDTATASVTLPQRTEPVDARRALLVEDSIDVARAMGPLLESRGYSVEYAVDVSSAMAILSEDAHLNLILSDFNLGGPLDGIDLLCRARLLHPESRCVLTTADTRPETAARARKAGLEMLQKPIRPELLV